MSTRFTQQLRQEANHLWQASLTHPFVRELADGTLPEEKFRHYVRNDSYYLTQFARVQSLAAAKATDLYTIARLAAHATATVEAEHALHETFFKLLNLSHEAPFTPAPTAYRYTSHLFSVAHTGTLAETIAVMLPCYWLYWEIGERYKDAHPNHPIYNQWISTYGQEWYGKLVQEQLDRLDDLTRTSSIEERRRIQQHFMISSQYEYEFWDMAYRLERWLF
ncbi:thiaminase II [Alicyclobacillaceae bacterium I2511]|nr:thiaminase II [Alicyclobacillaceae bacterium I2511]